MANDKSKSSGGARRGGGRFAATMLGMLIGLVLGLAIAVVVAVYVTRAPVPFVNKASRPMERVEPPAKGAELPDPNRPLAGKARMPTEPAPPASDTASILSIFRDAPPVPERPQPAPPVAVAPAAPLPAPAAAARPAPPTEAPAPPAARPPEPVRGDSPAYPGEGGSSSAPAAAPSAAAPTAPAAEAPKPPSSFVLQAGAFRGQDEADAMKAKLALLGLEARVQSAEVEGRPLYRVRVGPTRSSMTSTARAPAWSRAASRPPSCASAERLGENPGQPRGPVRALSPSPPHGTTRGQDASSSSALRRRHARRRRRRRRRHLPRVRAAAAQPGGFRPVQPQQPTDAAGKIEVVEFFWYGCPHCNSLEPVVNEWAGKLPPDVVFRKVHVPFNDQRHQQLFYTLETLGKTGELSPKVFAAIHAERNRMNTPDLLVAFAEKNGIDKKTFVDAFNSFGVQTRMKRATQLAEGYGVDGVPAFGVNGRWYTAPSMAGSNQAALKVVETLIDQERKAPRR
jgi:thiol:disulfide interchange protein DsbA